MERNGGLNLLFVINSHAGANDESWPDIISNYFAGKEFNVDYFLLDKDHSADALKKYTRDNHFDKVIAVGGDGTVTMVANVISGTKAALGIIPAGSANGMARELNIPEEPGRALSIIEYGNTCTCDAIKVNDKDISLHLSDLGLNAQLINYFDKGKLRGKLGYAKVLLKTLWRSQKINLHIHADNTDITTKAFMVVLANASKYGTGAVINPGGKIDDGLFEVVILRRLSLIELIKMMFGARRLNPEKIEILHTKSVTIQARKAAHFQIDGEYKGKVKSVKADVIAGYINIIRAPAEK